jgi:hypothetical protein
MDPTFLSTSELSLKIQAALNQVSKKFVLSKEKRGQLATNQGVNKKEPRWRNGRKKMNERKLSVLRTNSNLSMKILNTDADSTCKTQWRNVIDKTLIMCSLWLSSPRTS